jgi:hypothetical protein
LATRPVFVPAPSKSPPVDEINVDFVWPPGLSPSQARKSIAGLHKAAEQKGIAPCLEISSKSPVELGNALSAFNLLVEAPGQPSISVECAFQGSKVFERGGPFADLYERTSREAKKDDRLHTSGRIIAFRFFGEEFPVLPATAFYDWLYLQALSQNPHLAGPLLAYAGFTDIVFNPAKSLNCQARAAALYVAARQMGAAEKLASDRDYYLEIIGNI